MYETTVVGLQRRTSMGLSHWQCRDSGDNDNLCTKRKQSGKDSVIEAQPLLLFM
jgi:hypothetical protein